MVKHPKPESLKNPQLVDKCRQLRQRTLRQTKPCSSRMTPTSRVSYFWHQVGASSRSLRHRCRRKTMHLRPRQPWRSQRLFAYLLPILFNSSNHIPVNKQLLNRSRSNHQVQPQAPLSSRALIPRKHATCNTRSSPTQGKRNPTTLLQP